MDDDQANILRELRKIREGIEVIAVILTVAFILAGMFSGIFVPPPSSWLLKLAAFALAGTIGGMVAKGIREQK